MFLGPPKLQDCRIAELQKGLQEFRNPLQFCLHLLLFTGRHQRSQLLHVLRVHRFGAAASGFDGNAMLGGKLVHEGILTGQVVRYLVLWTVHLLDHLAGPQPSALWSRVQHELLTLDVGFGEVYRVGCDGDVGHDIAVADVVLDQRRAVAVRNAISPEPL